MLDEEGFARFGPYALVSRLGRGGMAETFSARRVDAGPTAPLVCLKRILPGLVDEHDLRALFTEEARLSAQLHHANIVPVVDFGFVDDVPYLVLERIDGVDFRVLLNALRHEGRPVPFPVLAHVARGVAFALDFAHAVDATGVARGIVHRDVSPSNVLLSRHGDVRLADFGVARATSSPRATRTGVLKGKLPYMAPEYVSRGQHDARSDLFALGVMLYECLAGERPFDGANDAETIERLTGGRYVPLASRHVHAPDAFAACVTRLLSVHPDDRYVSARAFLTAIEPCLPPPTARIAVGELVERAMTERADAALAKEPTARLATLVAEPTDTIPNPEDVASASPRDVTRTIAGY